MSELKPAIVVAAYNRDQSLARLLKMLARAHYVSKDVLLVISIDGGGAEAVNALADSFEWHHGEKRVICHEQNLGLREHILRCGDLTEKYGAIIMLEDDLGVSKFFYKYTLQALEQFSDNEKIAGISLYKPPVILNYGSNFYPMDNGLGYYYIQFPQSWGQVWTTKQWSAFRQWYGVERNRNKKLDVPKCVAHWPESSWLKYFTRYIIDENKYFVYPMKSLTTNFSDAGTHITKKKNDFQVPLADTCPRIIANNGAGVLAYDAYFEMKERSLRMLSDDLCEQPMILDLYGTRDLQDYPPDQLVLTLRKVKNPLQTWGFNLKPREINIMLNIAGSGIALCKCSEVIERHPFEQKFREFQYDRKWPGARSMLQVILYYIYYHLIGRD